MTQATLKELTNKIKSGNNIFGFFHNDLDGYGCGKVASTFIHMNDAKYLSYNRVKNEIEEFCKEAYNDYNGLIIADLNVDMDILKVLNKLAKTGYPVMYFDHHYKSEEQLEFLKKSRIIFMHNNSYCATSIMFKYFNDNAYEIISKESINLDKFEEIVNLIDAWDLFKWQDSKTFEILNEDARDFNIYFKEFGVEKTLIKINNYITGRYETLFSSVEKSNIILLKRNISKAVRDRNHNLITVRYPYNGEVFDIGITYAENDVSEIGNRLNILNKHLSFIVIIDMLHNSVNFRTIFDQPNLAEIAALYGGGGHPKAAGCPLNEKAFNAFANRYLREQVDMLLSSGKVIKKEEPKEEISESIEE